jgi:hypothetical protein
MAMTFSMSMKASDVCKIAKNSFRKYVYFTGVLFINFHYLSTYVAAMQTCEVGSVLAPIVIKLCVVLEILKLWKFIRLTGFQMRKPVLILKCPPVSSVGR